MNTSFRATLVLAAAALLPESAGATLIGDNVEITSDVPGLGGIVTVGAGNELFYGISDESVTIDIGDSSIWITLSDFTNFWELLFEVGGSCCGIAPDPFTINFASLDWVGSPGVGIGSINVSLDGWLIGQSAATAMVTSAHSISVTLPNNIFVSSSEGSITSVSTPSPSPPPPSSSV